MKKKFALKDLDCANCAAKFEAAVQKISGVQAASVSFMTQKLTIEAEEDQFPRIMEEVTATAKKVVPECKILL